MEIHLLIQYNLQIKTDLFARKNSLILEVVLFEKKEVMGHHDLFLGHKSLYIIYSKQTNKYTKRYSLIWNADKSDMSFVIQIF